LNKERKAHRHADSILHVSEGCALTYMNDLNISSRENIHVITNGFERNQKMIETPDSDTLSFCYTGSYYPNGKRNMRMLFSVISKCVTQGLISVGRIKIHCAGRNVSFLKSQAEEYGLGIVEIGGLVSRREARKIQQKSDMLIVLTWNEEEEQGLITGKFYEYLAMRKPIIALVSGDLPNAEISAMIDDLGVGISCEEANEEQDAKKLMEYLLMQYRRRIKGQELLYDVVAENVNKYDYENLTKHLESICYSLISDQY